MKRLNSSWNAGKAGFPIISGAKAEDIITTDGTVRAEKGEVVDTITKGENGTAESKELYLGKYEVKEVTAPYGMVLSDEVHAVELVYAGQSYGFSKIH